MAKNITIGGTTYSLPTQGQNPAWGKDISDIIEALSDVLGTLSGTGDILTTNFTIANGQSSAANVSSLSFDVGTIRSAIVSYSIYRSTSTAEAGECGFLLLTYLTTANAWTLASYSNDDSGVSFSITAAGQLQYVSDTIAGSSYSGLMKFNARAFTNS